MKCKKMSEEKTKREKIKDRILHLKKLAGNNPSKIEAEAAARAAAKFMAQHQITEAELVARGEQESEAIELDAEHTIYESGRSTPWKAELAWGISKLNGLFCLKFPIRDSATHRRGSRYRVFGRKSDIEIGIYMFEHLVRTIQTLADAEYQGSQFVVDANGRLGAKRGINPEKESWALGCVRGFLAKMNVERDAILSQGSSAAMVIVTNKAKEAEDAYVKKTGQKFGTTAPSRAQRDATAMSRGYIKGQILSVNPGLKK